MVDLTIFNDVLEDIKTNKYMSNLTDDDYSLLNYLSNRLENKLMYPFPFHGIYHSQKVMLFSYLLGKEANLDNDDMRILLDAARYHDIGRASESEKEEIHGYSSAYKIKKDFSKIDETKLEENKDNAEFMSKYNFYTSDNNLKILRAIIDAHSVPDKRRDLIFDNYEIDEDQRERYELLHAILKDADALDRARFPKQSKEAIKSAYLRRDYSKDLIDFAYEVNSLYVQKICERRYELFSLEFYNSTEEKGCLHGVGWDFVKLESILQNGILSKYAASKENIDMARNFDGENSNMWISVIDSEEINKGGDAYKKFIQNNISFYAFVPGYIKPNNKMSEAMSKGLPRNSGRYSDESFVFDKIPKENIYSVIIPEGMLDTPLKDLDYINCALSSNILKEKTKSYYDYLSNLCGYTNQSSLEAVNGYEQDLDDYEAECTKKVMDNVNALNIEEYKRTKSSYGKKINEEVSTWMDKAYRQYFGLKENESPTVRMVVGDILKRNNINYSIMSDDETIIKVDLGSFTK